MCVVGLGGLEPPTPRLSSVCSNQLSYRPRCLIRDGETSASSDICHLTSVICTAADRLWTLGDGLRVIARSAISFRRLLNNVLWSLLLVKGGDPAAPSGTATLLRLFPSHEAHLRRLPPKRVRPPASGVAHSRGVTGGVYKARERIHRGNADPRLLATPPSCRRISACNPNRDAL